MAHPNPATNKTSDYWTAFLLVAHILVLFTGFTLLAQIFDFPEVLRLSADERLARFAAASSIIIPTYWALAMTGFSQILISVLLAQSLRGGAPKLAQLSLVFGVVTGFGQAMGFGRWAILVPWLAERMADPTTSTTSRETIALLEGAFNRFAGMLVGEHLSNIAWGLWLAFTGLAILRARRLDRRLGGAMVILSPLMWLLASEQLGFASPVMTWLTDYGFPLLALIHFGLAWQLIRRPSDQEASDLGMLAYVIGAVLYAGMIWPVLTGQA